jgi:uncharacterized membrane protein YfcA
VTLLASLLAFLVGLSLGILGGGGSILTVPIFRYALGMEVKAAIGMSLGVVALTSLVGMLRHWRQGNVDLKALAIFAPAAVLSTYGGARFATFVPGVVQMVGLALVMGAAAILMWSGAPASRNPTGGAEGAAMTKRPRPEVVVGLGIGLGFLTGLLGVGGGFMIVPALVLFLGLEMKRAVGTSLGVIALNAASGFVGYLGQVTMDWALIAGFTAMAVVGVFVGAALVPRLSQQFLRRGFAVFLVLVATYILIKR